MNQMLDFQLQATNLLLLFDVAAILLLDPDHMKSKVDVLVSALFYAWDNGVFSKSRLPGNRGAMKMVGLRQSMQGKSVKVNAIKKIEHFGRTTKDHEVGEEEAVGMFSKNRIGWRSLYRAIMPIASK